MSPGLTCGLHFYRKGKNVHWTFQLFPISGSWADTVPRTVSLLHKAVEDFFNHVPFVVRVFRDWLQFTFCPVFVFSV